MTTPSEEVSRLPRRLQSDAPEERSLIRLAVLLVLPLFVLSGCGAKSARQGPKVPSATQNVAVGSPSAEAATGQSGSRTVKPNDVKSKDPARVASQIDASKACRDEARKGPEEQWAAKLKECDAQAQSAGEQPMTSSGAFRPMTVNQAREWWPFRPILRSSFFDGGKAKESIFAYSSKLSYLPDPTKEKATLTVVYSRPPVEPSNASINRIVENGGLVISHRSAMPPERFTADSRDKTIRVRGHEAKMWEGHSSVPDGSPSWWYRSPDEIRVIKWFEQAPNDRQLIWHVITGSKAMTEGDAVNLVEALFEEQG